MTWDEVIEDFSFLTPKIIKMGLAYSQALLHGYAIELENSQSSYFQRSYYSRLRINKKSSLKDMLYCC